MEMNDQYWSERYLTNNSGWDIGAPSTPIKTYIDQLSNKSVSILIPGGGNSYEAAYLSEQGFTYVTIADISAVVYNKLTEQYAGIDAIKIIHDDFFKLQGQYDLVLEQTFFCALDPSLRKAYVSKMYELLKPGGKLAGVLFNRAFPGGPPFGGSKDEYLELFSGEFDIAIMEDCYNSIPKRAGAELFIKLIRRN